MPSSLVVDIAISADEYLKWYSGAATNVYARSRDGRSVSFPANILQQFVGYDGINGSFLIIFDDDKRFQDIVKL